MNLAQRLAARMTETEKMNIRMSDTEDAIAARYFDFRPELSGSNLHGGTIEQGIEEMKEVQATLMADFKERSKSYTFPKSWSF